MRAIVFILSVICFLNAQQNIKLEFIRKMDVLDISKKLLEPSGLDFCQEEQVFWTVSDDTNKLFKLNKNGKIIADYTVDSSGWEGITMDTTKQYLYAVQEDKNEILCWDILQQKTILRKKLKDMQNYDSIKEVFSINENKGLEGITIANNGSFFVLKEGKPGMIIQISRDLSTILESRVLDKNNGFEDDDIKNKDIDYSGLCYDSERDCFWIVSDKAKRLFLYNWEWNSVVQDFALDYNDKQIDKAEGVAYDYKMQTIYIISDSEGRLYEYSLQ